MASRFLGTAFAFRRLALSRVTPLASFETDPKSFHASAFALPAVDLEAPPSTSPGAQTWLTSSISGTVARATADSGTFGQVLSCGRVRRRAGMATSHKVESAFVSQATRIVPGLVHDVWQQEKCQPKYPKLTSDEEADVVIVGAGIAGLSIAYNLVQNGKKVIVLERTAIGAGQTGRTTAHIMTWNDDYYYTLESKFGTKAASMVAESHKQSVAWMKHVVEKENIDCDFQLVPGYLFGHDDDTRHKAGPSASTRQVLDKEFDAVHRLGLKDTQRVHLGYDPKRGGIGPCLLFPGNGDFHPLKYLNGLARAVTDKGGKIFEQTRVMGQTARDVSTEDGHKVRARAVVLATNSPIDHNLAVHARQTADRSYVVGLKIPKGSLERAQWWDTAQPYHYVRTYPENDYEVLIVGGEDHPTGQSRSKYYDAYAKLEGWARERFPMAQEVLYRWTGQVYEPADNLGLYGVEPFSEALDGGELYIATGDSGQGMTGGTIAGIVIGDLILGKQNPWAEVYSPKRMIKGLSSLGPLAEEFAQNLKGYGELLLPASLKGVDGIAPGDGDIIQKGIHHLAVYKDPDGKVHEYSAICPHMKALIQWNPIDKTFDCPCHGSIFDRYGRVINGPAKADLFPAPA